MAKGVKLTPTNVQAVLDGHVAVIKERNQRSKDDVIEIGRRLKQCNSLVTHGRWKPWLEANFRWSYRTARNYIRLHEFAEEHKSATVALFDLKVLYVLSSKSTPPEVVSELIERAKGGELIDYDATLDAIEAHEQAAGQGEDGEELEDPDAETDEDSHDSETDRDDDNENDEEDGQEDEGEEDDDDDDGDEDDNGPKRGRGRSTQRRPAAPETPETIRTSTSKLMTDAFVSIFEAVNTAGQKLPPETFPSWNRAVRNMKVGDVLDWVAKSDEHSPIDWFDDEFLLAVLPEVEAEIPEATAQAPKKRRGRPPYPRDADGDVLRPNFNGGAKDEA
jgi:hypothetical protein